MTLIIDKQTGHVHFCNPSDDRRTLCVETARDREQDLLGRVFDKPMKETLDAVICPKFEKVYCAVKNETWLSVDDAEIDAGIYSAVHPYTKGEDNERD